MRGSPESSYRLQRGSVAQRVTGQGNEDVFQASLAGLDRGDVPLGRRNPLQDPRQAGAEIDRLELPRIQDDDELEALKASGARGRQMPVQAAHRVIRDHLAVIDDDDAIAKPLRLFHVVRRVDQRLAAPLQFLEILENRIA